MHSTICKSAANHFNILGGNFFTSHTAVEVNEDKDLSDFDISRIFDVETSFGIQDDVSGIKNMKPKRGIVEDGPNTSAIPKTTSKSIPLPPMSCTAGYVNLYMVLDPLTGQMTCPNQVLRFNNGGTVKTAIVGPSLCLDGLNEGQNFPHHHHQQQQHLSPLSLPMFINTTTQHDEKSNIKDTSNAYVSPSETTAQGEAFLHKLFASASTANSISPTFFKSTVTDNHPPKSPKLSEKKSDEITFRPLSAYNFFFQMERDKILNENSTPHGNDDYSEFMKQRILESHWNRDRTKKRRHRKSHGRISFIELSKQISARWKRLPEQYKQFYRDISVLDHTRFKRELARMSSSS